MRPAPALLSGAAAACALCALSCGRLGFDAQLATRDGAPVDAVDALAVDAPPDAPPADLQLSLTADIAYVAFVGTDRELLSDLGSAINGLGSGDITGCPVGVGPEMYTFVRASQPTATYLYIAAWDDEELDRGLVAGFTPVGQDRYTVTGDPGWEVCATGDWPGGMAIPNDARIGTHLLQCHAGSSASAGWVDASGATAETPGAMGHLVVGPEQQTGMPLGPVCSGSGGVPLQAKWVWYHPTLTDLSAFTATGSNDDRGFLIFRHPI